MSGRSERVPGRCADVRGCLPSFVGDDLEPPLAAGVRAHLRDCPACRGEASRFLQAQRALRGAAVAATMLPDVEEEFFTDLHAQVLDEVRGLAAAGAVPGRVDRLTHWLTTRSWWSVVAAAALFALGVATSQWIGSGGQSGEAAGGLLDRSAIEVVDSSDPGRHVQGFGKMLPLSHQESAGVGVGQGMMGRLELRTFEDAGQFAPTQADGR